MDALANITGNVVCVPDFKIAAWKPMIHALFIGLSSLAGTFGNVFVILSICLFYKNSLAKKPLTVFLGNLAVVDLITSVLYEPFLVVSILTNRWPFTSAFCVTQAALISVAIGVSFFTQAAIALYSLCNVYFKNERFQKHFSKRRAVVACGVMWLLSVFVVSLNFANGTVLYDYRIGECIDFSPVAWQNILLTASVVITPSLVIIVSYTMIYLHLCLHFRRFRNRTAPLATTLPANSSAISSQHRRRAKVVAKNCAMLAAAFYICYLPSVIIMYLGEDCYSVPYEGYILCSIVFYSGFSITPFVYSWKNPKFRAGVAAILRCRIHQHKMYLAGASPAPDAPRTKKTRSSRAQQALQPREKLEVPQIADDRVQSLLKDSGGPGKSLNTPISGKVEETSL